MQQLAHDIEQRRTDREMSLRREVYLEAAETIGKMQEFIANYAQSDDVGSSEIIALNGSIAALNKVHVIGAKSTIEAFNCAQRTFWSCRSRLSRIRMKVLEKAADLERSRQLLRSLKERLSSPSQSSRSIEIISDGKLGTIRLEDLQIETDIDLAQKSLNEAQSILSELWMEMAVCSVASSAEMMKAFSDVTVAVRRELNLDPVIESYQDSEFFRLETGHNWGEVLANLVRTKTMSEVSKV